MVERYKASSVFVDKKPIKNQFFIRQKHPEKNQKGNCLFESENEMKMSGTFFLL